MTQPKLPLPEAAFSGWKDLTREFGRSLQMIRQYGDTPGADWAQQTQTLRHIRRILHPTTIDQRILAQEKSRQIRDEPAGDLISEWTQIADDYTQLGFSDAAEAAHQKVALLRQVDWGTVPTKAELATPFGAPVDMQSAFDTLFETERQIATTTHFDDIRSAFASRDDDYTIISDEAFNTLMVGMLGASKTLRQEVASPAEQESIRKTFVALRPGGRKDFAKAVVAADAPIYRELWEYLPRNAADITRRSLWVGDIGLMLVVETPDGTDDDTEPYRVDVVVSAWPSEDVQSTFQFEASTKASRAKALAAGRAHIDQFTDAILELTTITNEGWLASLHKLPLIGSLMTIITMALRPRMTFRVFRGMGRQGVQSKMILRHTGRAIIWALLLWIFYRTGVTGIILQSVIAGIASGSDYAFVVGLCAGAAILGQAIPTSFGLLVGSFERRGGKGWSSNLPETGHENFITRKKKKNVWGWPAS